MTRGNFVDRGDPGICGGVAGVANGAAEIESIVIEQPGIAVGLDCNLEPSVGNGVVSPENFDSVGTICAGASAKNDIDRSRSGRPRARVAGIAKLKGKIG